MALHGDIQINQHQLLFWEAVRTTPDQATLDTICSYRCSIISKAGQHDSLRHFPVQHRYGDGPAVLAHKVLGEYLRLTADTETQAEPRALRSEVGRLICNQSNRGMGPEDYYAELDNEEQEAWNTDADDILKLIESA